MTKSEPVTLLLGDSLERLRELPANSVDACITDPPYGLAFMGKRWDYDVPSVDLWREVFRVLKPGAHLLSFGGTRTYHRMVCAIEDAGFEIRDQVMWIYGSGFPKSLDVSKAIDKAAGAEREVIGENPYNKLRGTGAPAWGDKLSQMQGASNITAPATDAAKAWSGWGTALKPANEPIVLARKPLERGLTVAQNVLKWGTGALAIDACRIGTDQIKSNMDKKAFQKWKEQDGRKPKEVVAVEPRYAIGRWPANVLFDESAAAVLDEQSGVVKSGGNTNRKGGFNREYVGGDSDHSRKVTTTLDRGSGGASRFFKVIKQTESDIVAQCLVESVEEGRLSADANSARKSAPENPQHAGADKNQNENTFAPIAESSSRTTKATKRAKKCSAPASAAQSIDSENRLDIANAVERLSKSITTDFAQRLAVIRPDLAQLIQCPASTPDSKKCIQYLDLASLAVNSESIDTIATILSLSKSYGSALPVTAESINLVESSTLGKSCLTRFIYQAKASKRERNAGLEGMPERVSSKVGQTVWTNQCVECGRSRPQTEKACGSCGGGLEKIDRQKPASINHHPTVKPVRLMQYLVRMITPAGGVCLDPFMGSGTTGVACARLGVAFIGIERESEYLEIARRRIEHASRDARADQASGGKGEGDDAA